MFIFNKFYNMYRGGKRKRAINFQNKMGVDFMSNLPV